MNWLDLLGLDDGWIPLQMDKGSWDLVFTEGKHNAQYDFKDNTMILTGGIGIAVYTNADGPPTDELTADCSGFEIKFNYQFITGKNSGFSSPYPLKVWLLLKQSIKAGLRCK